MNLLAQIMGLPVINPASERVMAALFNSLKEEPAAYRVPYVKKEDNLLTKSNPGASSGWQSEDFKPIPPVYK